MMVETQTADGESAKEKIENLKNWLHKQEHLPKNIDTEIISAFCNGTKSLEKARRKLETFFIYRKTYPKLFSFSVRDPSTTEFEEVARSIKMFILPQTTSEGYRVINTVGNDLDKYEINLNLIRFTMMIEVILKQYPECKGVVLFCDMKDQAKKVLRKMNFMQILNLLKWILNAIPLKFKKCVMYNADMFTDIFLNKLLKPFVPTKLFQRISVNRCGPEILKEFIEEKKLPSDFGGEELSSDYLHDQLMNTIKEHREWFRKTSDWIPDETKRRPN